MTEIRFVRRNRVDERFAIGAAIISACVALLSPASPTGSAITDGVVIAVAVGAVTWAAASAPWWAVAAACGISAVIALDPVVGVVAFLGFLGGLHVGIVRRNDGVVRAIAGGIAANTFLWSELEGFFGLSAIVGITTCSTLLLFGLLRRPSQIRRRGWQTLGVTAGLAVLAVIGAVLAGVGSRSDVSTAANDARTAIRTLNDGDYAGAADLFEQSSRGFDRGADQLGGVLAAPARLVPGLAQNLDAGRTLSDVAADATASAASALRNVDVAELTLSGGAIDVGAVAAVEQPLLDLQNALLALEDAAERVQSPWLVEPIQRQLDELDEEIAENEPRLENTIEAARLAPDLLGADGERRYLVVFTTPVEARGTAGFIGNWAEVVADEGRLTVEDFGRRSDLEQVIRESDPIRCGACPEELLTFHGEFGLTTGPGGTVGFRVWSNITTPTHFPYAAEAMASLYPDSGGRTVDGVISLDPYVVAELMRYTGPIEVPELGVTVTADDAAEFILSEQYVLAGDEVGERIEALETLGQEAITRILTAQLPDPPELARRFGPLVEERRLLVWTPDPSERAFLARIGMLGDLPALDRTDGGFAVTVTNGSGNKIEAFLDRTVEVTERTSADGQRELVADVVFTNNAPASGLPDYVIGNLVDLPKGSSRLIVTFFGPATAAEFSIDGERLAVSPITEAGWTGYRTSVDLLAGESATYQAVFDLPPDDDGTFDPTILEQPLRR